MTKASSACFVFSHVSVTMIKSAPTELASVTICWKALAGASTSGRLFVEALVDFEIWCHCENCTS